jgi:hypothetical protein
VTDRLDRMFSEVDRQLQDVRDQTTAVTARVGLLFSGTAVVTAILVAGSGSPKTGQVVAYVLLGVSLLLGILPLLPCLATGPDADTLGRWATHSDPLAAVTSLYDAKVMALKANVNRLQAVRILFYVQVGGVIVAVSSAIAAAIGR